MRSRAPLRWWGRSSPSRWSGAAIAARTASMWTAISAWPTSGSRTWSCHVSAKMTTRIRSGVVAPPTIARSVWSGQAACRSRDDRTPGRGRANKGCAPSDQLLYRNAPHEMLPPQLRPALHVKHAFLPGPTNTTEPGSSSPRTPPPPSKGVKSQPAKGVSLSPAPTRRAERQRQALPHAWARTAAPLSKRSHARQIAPKTVGLAAFTKKFYYGLGIAVANKWVLGGAPGLLGYTGMVAYLPTTKTTVVVMATTGRDSPSGIQYAGAIFDAVGKIPAAGIAADLSSRLARRWVRLDVDPATRGVTIGAVNRPLISGPRASIARVSDKRAKLPSCDDYDVSDR